MIRKINGKQVRILSGNVEQAAQLPTVTLLLDYVYVAGGTFKVGDVIFIRTSLLKSGTANSYVIRLYWNTTYSTSGATQIATYTIPSADRNTFLFRRLHFSTSATALVLNTSFSSNNDMGDSATTFSTVSVASWLSTSGYFFLSCDAGGARITDTIRTLYISMEI